MTSEAHARYEDFYRRSLDDPERFWLEAAQRLEWRQPPTRALQDHGRRPSPGFPTAAQPRVIIKTAGHRLGTIEVETAFLRHPAVAEAGVTAVPDELRGEVIAAFVALRAGHEASAQLATELRETVRHELGPVAVIRDLSFVSMLPT